MTGATAFLESSVAGFSVLSYFGLLLKPSFAGFSDFDRLEGGVSAGASLRFSDGAIVVLVSGLGEGANCRKVCSRTAMLSRQNFVLSFHSPLLPRKIYGGVHDNAKIWAITISHGMVSPTSAGTSMT
jgi:hypothetical protein